MRVGQQGLIRDRKELGGHGDVIFDRVVITAINESPVDGNAELKVWFTYNGEEHWAQAECFEGDYR